MLDTATVHAGIAEIFADLFMREIEITPELTANDVPERDSFRQVEIIMSAEARFHVSFTAREVDSFHTLGDLMNIVQARGHL